MARFHEDEIVQDKNDSTRYGPVKQVLPLEGGVQYYKVLWPHPHGMMSVLEEDLVPFNTERGPMSDFLESVFSGRDEFLRLVTSYRLSETDFVANEHPVFFRIQKLDERLELIGVEARSGGVERVQGVLERTLLGKTIGCHKPEEFIAA